MQKQSLLIGSIVFLILIIGAGAVYISRSNSFGNQNEAPQAENKNDTAKAVASYHNASADLIVVDSPQPGSSTNTTFTATGKARGTWYFEATFPVKVLDANGNELGTAIAHAQGDWMTEDFVPFTAEISLENSYSGAATIVFHKDNPSGEASREASLSVPITITH